MGRDLRLGHDGARLVRDASADAGQIDRLLPECCGRSRTDRAKNSGDSCKSQGGPAQLRASTAAAAVYPRRVAERVM